MYLLTFYVPESHLEAVKSALFRVGAGQVGSYSHCAWQVLGQGQFCPESGSNPYLGAHGEVEKVAEYRVELLCLDSNKHEATQALISTHPYETPAYHWIKLDQSQE